MRKRKSKEKDKDRSKSPIRERNAYENFDFDETELYKKLQEMMGD